MTGNLFRFDPPPPEGSAGGGRARGDAPGGEAPLEWTVNPWRVERPRAVAAAAAVALVWAVLVASAGGPLLVMVLGAAVTASVGPALVPGRFRVDGEGVARRLGLLWERRPWRAIRRARLLPGGLFVSPLAAPSFRDRFRGLFLPVPTDLPDHERLRCEIRERLDRHGL